MANTWDWTPPKTFSYVYALYDCVPADFLGEYVERLLTRAVRPGGRLIIGAYGSRSGGTPPFDIKGFLKSAGYTVASTARSGSPPISSFAWVSKAPGDYT